MTCGNHDSARKTRVNVGAWFGCFLSSVPTGYVPGRLGWTGMKEEVPRFVVTSRGGARTHAEQQESLSPQTMIDNF